MATRPPKANPKHRLLELAHHRNGVCGTPFWVARFVDSTETPQRVMVAIYFGPWLGGSACAVLDIARLAGTGEDATVDHSGGTVAFGANSWRGDHYVDSMRAWIRKQEGGRS